MKIEFQHGLLNSDPDILTRTRPIFLHQYREWPFGHSNWTTKKKKKEYGLQKTCEIVNIFFFWVGQSLLQVCVHLKSDCRQISTTSPYCFRYLWGEEASSWGLSGHYLGDATALVAEVTVMEDTKCVIISDLKRAWSFQTSHYTVRAYCRPALCFICCYLSSTS